MFNLYFVSFFLFCFSLRFYSRNQHANTSQIPLMSVSWALVETVDCLLMQIIRFELANVVFDQWTSFDALSAHGKRTRNDDKLLRLSTQNEWLTCGLFCTTHKIMCLFYSSGSMCCSMSTIFSYQQTNSAKRAHTFCCFSFFMSQ